MNTAFIAVLLMSATGTLLVLCLALLRPLTKKRFSASWHYHTYIIAVFFLLVPIGAVGGNLLASIPSEREMPNVPVIISNMLASPQNNTDPAWQAQGTITNPNIPAPAAVETVPVPAAEPILTWNTILSHIPVIWLCGAFLFILWHSVRLVRFKRKIHLTSLPIEDTATIKLLINAMNDMRIKGKLRLYSNDVIKTPMLVGIFKTRLILPEVEMNDRELAVILRHELIHYKRRDLWVKSLALLANAIHCFNPAVYRLTKQIDTFCELSCDERVVSGMSMEERRFYGETILNVLCRVVSQHSGVYATLAESKKGIEKRLTHMMSVKKSPKRVALISLAVVALLCLIGFTAASIINVTGKISEVYYSGSWEDFLPLVAEKGFLPAKVTGALPDFNREEKEDGLILYSWSSQDESKDYYIHDVYLAAADNVMTTYHYRNNDFDAPLLNEYLSADMAFEMAGRFAGTFIPNAALLTFEYRPDYYGNSDPDRIMPWVAEYAGIGEYIIFVDIEMGGVIFFTYTPSEFAGMTKTFAADGSIAATRWDNTTYLPFGPITDTSLFRQFSFVDGDVNDIIYGLNDYTLRDWMINYDESKAAYILFKAEHVTEIPPELGKWEYTPSAVNQPESINISSLTLDASGRNDDTAELLGRAPDEWYYNGVEIAVVLGNGSTYSKVYNEDSRNSPALLHSDLTGDGIDEMILILPNVTSNFGATNVHVLSAANGELAEILTVLCTPIQEDIDKYAQSWLGIQDFLCTGATVVGSNGQTVLRIEQLGRYYKAHTDISWAGGQWAVGQQEITKYFLFSNNPQKTYDIQPRPLLVHDESQVLRTLVTENTEDFTQIVYRSRDAELPDVYFYSYIETGGVKYDLGQIGYGDDAWFNSGLKNSKFSRFIDIDGETLYTQYKWYGAAYAATAYYELTDGIPHLLYEIPNADDYYIYDRLLTVVSVSRSNASNVTLYCMDLQYGMVYSEDLSELLDCWAAGYDREQKLIYAYGENNETDPISVYKLEGLELVKQ